MFYANVQLQNTFNLLNNLSKHQRFNVNNVDVTGIHKLKQKGKFQ